MALQRSGRALVPVTRTLTARGIPRTSLPASFTSLPASSRPFTSSTRPLLAASPSSSHASHDGKGHGAGGHQDHHGEGDRHAGPDYGIHFHQPERWHRVGAQVFGGLLWFWLLYRAKNDWRYLFFWDNPFDSHDHGNGHEGAAHEDHDPADEHH